MYSLDSTFGLFTGTSTAFVEEALDFNECRSCGHIHYNERYEGYCSNCFLEKDKSILYNSAQPCFCKELIPLDNLEYLEYLYNQKEKVS